MVQYILAYKMKE